MFIRKIKHSWQLVFILMLIFSTGSALGQPAASLPASVDVTLGATGTSFGYAATLGVTGVPYLSDTEHLYGPDGMTLDKDDNLFVVERAGGQRMVKYNYYLLGDLVIGHAGIPGTEEDFLNDPADVAVTATGDIWVVMDSAVKQFDSTGELVRMIPNEPSPAPGMDDTHFNDPQGIAFDSMGRLYVADTGNHRVQIYRFDGGTPVHSATLGVDGETGLDNYHFNRPAQVAFPQADYLFVADSGNHRVQMCAIYDQAIGWECQTFMGEPGVPGAALDHLNTPMGIGIRDNVVYIADTGNYRVLRCPASIPTTCTLFKGETGVPGSDDTHFIEPADVAVDKAGNVFVSDLGNHRIQMYYAGGTETHTIGTTLTPYATSGTYFFQPAGTAVDAANNRYVLEGSGRRLSKVDPAGSVVWDYGTAGLYGSSAALLGTAAGGPEGKPAVASSGLVYFTDTLRHRVVVLNANGTLHSQLGVTDVPGSGNNQFNTPAGVAISPVNGDVFVLDRGNQRIQVFSKDRVYKTSLTAATLCGAALTDCLPWDAAIDLSGNLFVADAGNLHVQKCTLSLTGYACSKFAGTTGEGGSDFDHLSPVGVAVDRKGKVYVADGGDNQRIQVFSAAGAYLTTLGGGVNSLNSGFNNLAGVAVGADGTVYATDQDHFRVQTFTPGFPGWQQSNINGFGNPAHGVISTLEVLDNYLYAGTWYGFSQVWRTSDGKNWSQVTPTWTVTALGGGEVFDGALFLGAYSLNGTVPVGEVWRTDGVTWTRVVPDGFGDPTVIWINDLVVFNNQLYAVTENSDKNMQIWRSSTGEGVWEQVGAAMLDAVDIRSQKVLFVYNNQIYLGRSNAGKAELWHSADGLDWSLVNITGLGALNSDVSSFAEFNGSLYVGFRNEVEGGEVWVSPDGLSFSQVFAGGLGDVKNIRPYGLQAYHGALYLSFSNDAQGAELWKSTDGSNWQKVMSHGWGDWNNTYASYFDKSIAVFRDTLYIATINTANGGEVWRMMFLVNVPLIMR